MAQFNWSAASSAVRSEVSFACRNGIEVFKSPSEFFRQRQGTVGYRQSAKHALVMHALSGFIISFYGLLGMARGVRPPLVNGFFGAILWGTASAFLAAGLLQAGLKLLGGRGSGKDSVLVFAYSMSVFPVVAATLPLLPIAVAAWCYGFYIAARGVLLVHQSPTRKTAAVFALAALLLLVLFSGAPRRGKGSVLPWVVDPWYTNGASLSDIMSQTTLQTNHEIMLQDTYSQ